LRPALSEKLGGGETSLAIYQTYTVGAGDTLSGIARVFKVSEKQLSELNGIRNRHRINVGQVLRVRQISETYLANEGGGAVAAAEREVGPAPGLPSTASSISPIRELGNLSRKYEVGARGPETVSTGKGDRGGVSYGCYQLASNLGRPAEFLKAEGSAWRERFGGSAEGSPQFSHIWRKCAKEDAKAFEAAQHKFIERTHYAVQLAKVKKDTGIDLSTRSRAVQDVAWSVAVQHGPRNGLIVRAVQSLNVGPDDPGFDRALIEAVYAERGRRDPDGRLAHFRGNSLEVQESVAKRFRNERNDAMAMLDAQNAKQEIAAAVMERGREADTLLKRVAAKMSDEDAYRVMEKYGDDEARSEWMAGKKIAIALRRPTNWKEYKLGVYDDPLLLIWREGQTVKVERFWCTTEPAGVYAFGNERASRGSSTDLDKDGRTDLGRLTPGVYHFQAQQHAKLGAIYKARDIQVVERDVNHDGNFTVQDPGSGDAIDRAGAGRTMYIHKGGSKFTASAGCQTLEPATFARFRKRLAGQEALSYLLINAE